MKSRLVILFTLCFAWNAWAFELPEDPNLPAPPITIHAADNPSPGYIFLATWDRNIPHVYGNYIFILDSHGTIVESVRVDGAPYDFQVQPNGLLSFALGGFSGIAPGPGEELRHVVLDETLSLVDSFKMENEYPTDFHEFLMLPNGHTMMMSYHSITYDMSRIVEGGKTDAELVINIIQEQDRDKNVVWEWRNIDHIPITDSDLNLTDARINYSTLNGFTVDHDGHILASFRNHSEIMKISRATGEILWRMGGPRSEFTFVGEHEENAPYYFSRQHHVQRLPNGNISLFDNGEFHKPPYSRAVEYHVDEVNKVATLVSEWRYPEGNIFCATAGNAQKLPGGGWFIGYGVPHPQQVQRNVVEVHPDGSIALEISLPKNVLAYRVSKLPWRELVSKPSYTRFEVQEGNTYSFNDDSTVTGIGIKYLSLTGAGYNLATVTRSPYGPRDPEFFGNLPDIYPLSFVYEGAAIESHRSEVHVMLSHLPEVEFPETTSMFWRPYANRGLFLPIPTTYDGENHELIGTVSGFGEIVLGNTGVQYNVNIPLLYEPLDKTTLLASNPIVLRWTGQGYADEFQLQVSTDSQFGTTIIDTYLSASFIYLDQLDNHTTYYWRVRAFTGFEEGEWSSVWSFATADPYIVVNSPNGGEEWAKESTEVIRWETNITDPVSIDLLAGQQHLMSIGTIAGSVQAFSWAIPEALPPATDYAVQITSQTDGEVIDVSDSAFSIVETVVIDGDQ